MNLAWRDVRAYVRFSIVAFAVFAVVLVLFKNRNNYVSFWFFGITDEAKPINVVWLVLSTSAVSLNIAWLTRMARGLIRDFRDMKQQAVKEAEERKQVERAAALDERERCIEERLKEVSAASAGGKTDSKSGSSGGPGEGS